MSKGEKDSQEKLTWGYSIFNRAVAILLVLFFDAQEEEPKYVEDYRRLNESSDIYTAEVTITKNELWQLIISKYRGKIEDVLKGADSDKASFWNFFDSEIYDSKIDKNKFKNYEQFGRYVTRLINTGIFNLKCKKSFEQGIYKLLLEVKIKQDNKDEEISFIENLIFKWNNNDINNKNNDNKRHKITRAETLYALNQSQKDSESNSQDLSSSEKGEDEFGNLGDYFPKKDTNLTKGISKEQIDNLKPYIQGLDIYLLAWAVMEGICINALSKWIDFDNYNSGNSLRLESFWKIVLEDFKNLTDGTPSLISVFKTLVVHPEINNNRDMKDKIIKWLECVKPGIDFDKSIISDRPVKVYLLVAVEQHSLDNSWIVRAELRIPDKAFIPFNVLLEENSPDIYQNISLERLIPQYIEKLLDINCVPYLRSIPDGNYKLLIEIFLPFDYLAESVDLWSIVENIGLQREQKFGDRYRVIVRSYERIKKTRYLSQLKVVWKEVKDIDPQDFANRLKRLESQPDYNYKNLENELKEQHCIGLSCFLPEEQEERDDVFLAIHRTGVPLALWLRSRNIEGNYLEDFERLLCPKYLQQNCEGLIDEIFKKRQQLPNDPQEAEKQWGYHAALLLDNPERTPSFNDLGFADNL